MQRLLPISILFATIVIPTLAARDRSAQTGLKKALFLMLAFNILYLLGLKFIYPRLF